MKIKYEFVTEAVEIEVTDDWGSILVDLDRQEYNINHKETRRHCSLDAFNLDNALFPSDVDVVQDILKAEDDERLYSAITKLEPRQQKLIQQVFFEERGYADIARSEGLDESAIRHATTRALKKLKNFKNFLEKPSESGHPVAYL